MKTKILQRLIRIRDKRKNELNRRSKREKYLQLLADHEYKYNMEQWEALNECIRHQQNRMLRLISEIHVIEEVLAGIESREDTSNEWHA